MSLKDSYTKKIAAAACAAGILLFGAACTSTVSGAATYSGDGKEETTTSDTEESSSDDEESTTEESTGGGYDDPDTPPAAAPAEPYGYDNGVTITLAAPIPDDTLDGLLPDETGRILTFTMVNPDTASFDMSSYRYDSVITCPDASVPEQYVLTKSEPDTGPEILGPGETGNYTMKLGIRKDAVGTVCYVEIIFTSDEYSSIDSAVFSITF